MADLEDGQSVEMKGSGATPYVLKNDGGIYSCTCPAWRHQSAPIDKRTCKHLKKLRGEQVELDRVGVTASLRSTGGSFAESPGGAKAASDDGDEAAGKAPPLLLAERWPDDHDPTGWWVSEKLDGVRAYWDGTQFLSRLGNRFVAPRWFVEGLPDHPLDGELWAGRKRFQETVSTVRRVDGGERWKEISFVVFDAPGHDGGFEDRIGRVADVLGDHTPYARPLPHAPCEGIEHLRDELLRVERLGGEGLMLRQPRSRYEVGRSSTLLKVKTFFDAEAVVVGHVAGAGKHKGRLGSLLVENADGVRFNVGTGLSDAERGDPPPLGALITYRYQELSRDGVPRFPSFVGVRIDGAPIRPRSGPSVPGPRASGPTSSPSGSGGANGSPSGGARGSGSANGSARASGSASGFAGTGWAPEQGVETERGAQMGRRRFEFEDGSSSKFWEVEQDGGSFTVTYGRIGTSGQSKTKDLGSDAAAAREVAKLIEEKTGKGYVEAGGGAAAPERASAAPARAASARTGPSSGRTGGSAPPARASKPSLDDDGSDDDESLELEDEADSVRALAKEVRPLLSKVKARLRTDFPTGLPVDALESLGLDESEIEELSDFVATIGEVDQLFARLAGR